MSTWFMTGASSGLGAAFARTVLEHGHNAVITARDSADVDHFRDAHPDTALPVALDVTDRAAITAAVTAADEAFDGIDVLVNNAGYGYTAAVEEGDRDDVDRVFATNFFGPLDLITTALPRMRARGHGLIINISSIGARTPIPGGGYYAATKAALEALSGALRREVTPMGLAVMVVEPGSMRTDFRGRSAAHARRSIDAYDTILGRDGHPTLSPQRGDPVKAAQAIMAAASDPEPPQLLVLGTDAVDARRSATAALERDVARYTHLSTSTDHTP